MRGRATQNRRGGRASDDAGSAVGTNGNIKICQAWREKIHNEYDES
jgi:hypothetical protein